MRGIAIAALLLMGQVRADISVHDVTYSYEREKARIRELIRILQNGMPLLADINASTNRILKQKISRAADDKDHTIDDMFQRHSVGATFRIEATRSEAASLQAKQYIIETNILNYDISRREIRKTFK